MDPDSPSTSPVPAAEINNFLSEDDEGEAFLYDADLLSSLTFEGLSCFNPPVRSPSDPGQDLRVRPLSSKDYERGFVKLLSQLTKVGDVSKADFLSK